MDLLPCVEIEPPRPPTRGSVVWLHGLGADGHDFVPVAPHLHLSDVRFVFPHAPAMPVTINGGYVMPSWYDILTWDRVPGREKEADIRASAARIEALIRREVERGVPVGSIVLAGFSQGAAMALHVGLRYPERLRGIVCLSGYLVLADSVAAEAHAANAATPIYFGHGTEDDVVPLEGGRHAWETLREGRDARWSTFRMGHEVVPAEIADLRRWLRETLPASP